MLKIEARQEDEALVARLVSEKRRALAEKRRSERSSSATRPFTTPGPSHRLPKSRATTFASPSDPVGASKRQVDKEESLFLLAEAKKEKRKAMELQAAQDRLRELAIQTADAILYEE